MATSKAARSKFAEAQTPALSVLRWYVRLREGSERSVADAAYGSAANETFPTPRATIAACLAVLEELATTGAPGNRRLLGHSPCTHPDRDGAKHGQGYQNTLQHFKSPTA